MLRVFYHGFWEEPSETTPFFQFFQHLLERVLGTKIGFTNNIEEGDILVESVFLECTGSKFAYKKLDVVSTHVPLDKQRESRGTWAYTFFFSMENRIVPNYPEYDCVLWGEDIGGNVVCCPAFVPHLYANPGLVDAKERVKAPMEVEAKALPPKKRICVIISNPGGQARNAILDVLEQHFPVDYAGRYRNNVPVIRAPFSSPEFLEFVGQYRCVLAMENSRGGAYITEKITHGLLAGTVPIYWGAHSVGKYLNEDRFIHVRDVNQEELERACQQIHTILNDDDAYRTMVSQPIFRDASGKAVSNMTINMDTLTQEMQRVLQIKSEST